MRLRDAPGFFGKIPGNGDFVARRLPRAFTDPWDAWLQAGIADSQTRLGDAWLPVYLNSPIWRFALGAGVCGPQSWYGVMMPSVDRVSRCFPFTIAAGAGGGAMASGAGGVPSAAWYAELEALALSALGAGFSLPGCDAALAALPQALSVPGAEEQWLAQTVDFAGQALFWLCDGGGSAQPTRVTGPEAFTAALFADLLQAPI